MWLHHMIGKQNALMVGFQDRKTLIISLKLAYNSLGPWTTKTMKIGGVYRL